MDYTELKELAEKYNDLEYFGNDPIMFPRKFMEEGEPDSPDYIRDIEIAAVISAHLAWGRRDLIFRDCTRAFDEMEWKPYRYILSGEYRHGKESLHRTIRWDDFSMICSRLRNFYLGHDTLENLETRAFRTEIYGQKDDPSAANKKIRMLKRWMVRNDGKVDLGIWKNSSPADLVIPLDVHVHRSALKTGLTSRKSADNRTALEITENLKSIFPGDPCKGDFALFAYAAINKLR